jgi:hypothetical protein
MLLAIEREIQTDRQTKRDRDKENEALSLIWSV